MTKDIFAIILAAGKGTRMKSTVPKVLHKVVGKAIVCWTLELLETLGINKVVVVVGDQGERVKNTIKKAGFRPKYALQSAQKGTAHSVKVGLKHVSTATVLVLYGDDSALYKPATLRGLVAYHLRKKNKSTLLVVKGDKPDAIGGLERDEKGRVTGVLTKSELERAGIVHPEVVCGAFCFDKRWLERNLKNIKPSLFSGEYPLPGLIQVGATNDEHVDTYLLKDVNEWNSVNTKHDLKMASTKKEVTLNV